MLLQRLGIDPRAVKEATGADDENQTALRYAYLGAAAVAAQMRGSWPPISGASRQVTCGICAEQTESFGRALSGVAGRSG